MLLLLQNGKRYVWKEKNEEREEKRKEKKEKRKERKEKN